MRVMRRRRFIYMRERHIHMFRAACRHAFATCHALSINMMLIDYDYVIGSTRKAATPFDADAMLPLPLR